MLKNRLNKDDNIASELLDNIFVQVNSMSDLVKLDYLTNTNTNSNNHVGDNSNSGIYIDNKNILDDSNVNEDINDDNAIVVINDIDDELWNPVKEEIDITIDDDISNNNDRK